MDAIQFFEAEARAGGGQRRWPNEEFARFMGRHFFGKGPARILEMGCGSGANLRLIADEGFEAWGVDASETYVQQATQFLKSKGLVANVYHRDMTDTRLAGAHFDAVIDVFSAYCLNDDGWQRMLAEAARLLKLGGRFFSFTPSATTAHLQRRIFGVNDSYLWHFTTGDEFAADLKRHGFADIKHGTLRRTDGFEFVVIEARHGTATAAM